MPPRSMEKLLDSVCPNVMYLLTLKQAPNFVSTHLKNFVTLSGETWKKSGENTHHYQAFCAFHLSLLVISIKFLCHEHPSPFPCLWRLRLLVDTAVAARRWEMLERAYLLCSSNEWKCFDVKWGPAASTLNETPLVHIAIEVSWIATSDVSKLAVTCQ